MFWQLRHKWFGTEFVLLVNRFNSIVHKVSIAPSGVLIVASYYDTLTLDKGGRVSEGSGFVYWQPLTNRMSDFYKFGYDGRPKANAIRLVGGTKCK